ncbi:glycosyltransferase family 2 protein [bacterium]|nr:glycosyltransferase family 2 protein [bacterium]
MENRVNVSIVIPVYNSQHCLADLVEELTKVLEKYKKIYEIILVNDGSHDNSSGVCCELVEKYSSLITFLSLSKNFGEHNAVMAGLNYANGDYVVIMDDDFQNSPEDVPLLIEKAITGPYDIVYTFYKKKQHNCFRNAGSWFNNWIATLMLNKPGNLYLSSFKCLSRFVVQEIIKYKGPFPYIDGLALRCTRNIGKLEVQHKKRKKGQSGYTFKKLIRLWFNMFINFSIKPLRISFCLGLLFSCLGIIISIVVIVEKLLYPETPLGWSSLVIAVMVFSGVQLLILGVLGEYVGHLLLSSNETPQFVIRKVYKGEFKSAR